MAKRHRQITSKILRDPVSKVDRNTLQLSLPTRDSLVPVLLVSELEKQFKVKLNIRDYSGLENLGDHATLLKEKGAKVDLQDA